MSVYIPEPLSAKDPTSFAYFTLRDRLPIIVTKIIDHLYRDREQIAPKAEMKEDLKMITGHLAQLKNEMQTDKSLTPLQGQGEDKKIWNDYLEHHESILGKVPTWYTTDWLYLECYMYRRIYEAFADSNHLKNFDYFGQQKEDGFYSSLEAIRLLAPFLQQSVESLNENFSTIQHQFLQLLKITLWSNRCDLSISAGAANAQKENPIAVLETLEKNILIDDSNEIWNVLQSLLSERRQGIDLAIILDNSGFELFCDFCLAYFLVQKKIAHVVRFYVKSFPWYVSDTTEEDFLWTLNMMRNLEGDENKILNDLASKWLNLIQDKKWKIEKEPYWTYPFDYADMRDRDTKLYKELSKTDFIIFKGDLNYRKLVGDRNWNPGTAFATALQGFEPTSLCTLRTLKADLVVGLPEGRAQELDETVQNWQTTGEYAVIQLLNKSKSV